MNLTTKVLLALALGVLAGLALNTSDLTNNTFADAYLIDGLFTVVGLLFLNSLKMIVVPLVFFALIPLKFTSDLCGYLQLTLNYYDAHSQLMWNDLFEVIESFLDTLK